MNLKFIVIACHKLALIMYVHCTCTATVATIDWIDWRIELIITQNSVKKRFLFTQNIWVTTQNWFRQFVIVFGWCATNYFWKIGLTFGRDLCLFMFKSALWPNRLCVDVLTLFHFITLHSNSFNLHK